MEKQKKDAADSPDRSGQQLNRNRSFKSKQLVRSQAIRESTSPPRTPLPPADALASDIDSPLTAVNVTGDSDSQVTGVSVNVTRELRRNSIRTIDSNDEASQERVEVVCDKGDADDKRKELQTRSNTWDGDMCPMQRQNKQWSKRDLLSHSPRVTCVCGTQRRNQTRKPMCCSKQDSGISCSDEYSDDHNASDSNTHCYCEKDEVEGQELVSFIKETLNRNPKDRNTLMHIEKELHALVNDTGRCIVRFPVMSSYGRMLVHRAAALFHLAHHLDINTKTAVLVSKSGTSGGRIPCTSFKQWCTTVFPPSPQKTQDTTHAKSILKRDTNSLDEPGCLSRSNSRSKSLEQREKEYERVRRRIFSTDNCNQDESQWPWLSSAPVKLLTPDAAGKSKLLKVHSLETSVPPTICRGAVSKSHSFGGYGGNKQPRILSRQGDLASSSWRVSPSSSGYKTLSLRSTDSVTPSPTGGASPEPLVAISPNNWPPIAAVVIHPQTGRPLTNPDGSIYQFDPSNPPYLYDANAFMQQQVELNTEKRRGRLEKQHSFIDQAECECQSDDRKATCVECQRRQEACQRSPEKPQPTQQTDQQKPAIEHKSPIKTKNNPEPTKTTPDQATNQKPFETTLKETAKPFETKHNHQEGYAEQNPVQNYAKYQHSYDKVVESHPRFGKVNHEGVEMPQYIQHNYIHGYRHDEVTSPQVLQHAYIQPDMNLHNMAMHKIPIMQDPNLRPIPMANMLYPTPMPQPYQYVNQCRIEQPMQPVYQHMMHAEEQKQMIASPHAAEGTFRIDPSYPYAPVDYSQCGACVDTNTLHPHHRSYNVSVAGVEVPVLPVQQACPVPNVVLPQPQMQHYPMNDVQWALNRQYHKVGTECPCPTVCPPYIMYPQMIPQPYQVCHQPIYQQVLEKPDLRHTTSARQSKQNSLTNSSRTTPITQTVENKPSDDGNKDKNDRRDSDIALKIQQIKEQMAQLNRNPPKREDWRKNNGNGILGSHPSHFNGRFGGNSWEEEVPLTPEATAIFNILRMRHKHNTYPDRRNVQHNQYRPEQRQDRDRRRPRDERERDGDNVSRQYNNVYRQMAPGTWCRRSPAPVHPALNQARRPHPDTRNGRR